MNLTELLDRYQKDPRTEQIGAALPLKKVARFHLKGLIGSQSAFVASAVYKNKPAPHIFILEDKEEVA